MKNNVMTSKEEFELMFKDYIIPLLGINSNNSQYRKHIMKKKCVSCVKKPAIIFL